MGKSRYHSDFYSWANEQSALLKSGQLAMADINHIAEELEAMGSSELNELDNRLIILLMHLLQWRYQPKHRSSSWKGSIGEQRRRLAIRIRKSPGLKPKIPESMEDAYHVATLKAANETGLPESTFPDEYPWDYQQATDEQFCHNLEVAPRLWTPAVVRFRDTIHPCHTLEIAPR